LDKFTTVMAAFIYITAYKIVVFTRVVSRRYCHCNSSVRLSVTLAIHTKTVQGIEIRFRPSDTILGDDALRQIS